MEKTYIKGNFRRTIFKSDKGFIIGLFKVRDTTDEVMRPYINKTVTFTGYFHDLNPDDLYFFYGDGVKNERYGFQYQVKEYERVKPEGKDGVIEFLASDLFPGVGAKSAEMIVETLGEDTLNLILENVSNLYLVPKMTEKKAKKIFDILTKYNESHSTIVYLSDLGFNMRDSLNIYNTYKSSTIVNLEHNIYKIAEDIVGINFETLDKIARKLNIEANDPRRVKAAIIYIMKAIMFKQGDTYLEKEEIASEVLNMLEHSINHDEIEDYLFELKEEEKIVIDEYKHYIKSMYDSENYITEKISRLNNLSDTNYKKIDKEIGTLEGHFNIDYNDEQKRAISEAMHKNFLIITGGPGTGKTTIIKAIVELYKRLNNYDYDKLCERISLLAPTGRAAKRMSEATLLPASTIHRFLKWNKDNNEFQVNEDNKDFSEFIIVDEVSMIDTNLFASLLKGLTNNVKIILVGDANQLPSVSEGQVLKDLIESEIINTIELKNLYRQDEDSYMVDLAYAINSGEMDDNYTDKRSDYNFIECSSQSIKENVVTVASKALEKGFDIKDIQVLAPMYKGENGIDALNEALQNLFNKKELEKKEVRNGDVIFREGDKVIQLVNQPDDNIFNGDIGFIKYIKNKHETDSKKNEIFIDYEGNTVKYLPKDFLNFKHGYAISIHKSQGSEFDLVIMPMTNHYSRMLYRKIIYTGVTRAKKSLVLIGGTSAFMKAVNNSNERIRKTGLRELFVKKNN